MKLPIALAATAAAILLAPLAAAERPLFRHLSSLTGELPTPGPSSEQTGSLVADLDNDGVNDFVVATRVVGPSVTWFRRTGSRWAKLIIDSDFLPVEAGGAAYDIDSDGDLDIVFGGDSGSNRIWWWENPSPNFDPHVNWKRRLIKDSGGKKHHDQIFGDFNGDGAVELVTWNQRAEKLLLLKIPPDPRSAGTWPIKTIYSWSGGAEHEGLAAADVNQDGKLDLIGGGRWFEHLGGDRFKVHLIADEYRYSRAAAGQFVKGGRPEIVFAPGDVDGPLRWFEWTAGGWKSHSLIEGDLMHGHSIGVGDVDRDGNDDIFSAEMGAWGGLRGNPSAKMRVFYGDGRGGFEESVLSQGFGNHESRLADLDGDGDLDILSKPYYWRTPRIDVWLNEPPAQKIAIDKWERHVIDAEKPWRAVFIAAGDLNGDSLPDIVTGGWWYENPGRASAEWKRRDVGEPLRNFAVLADFDFDGDLDILGTEGKASDANAHFVWAENDGAGAFTLHTNIPAGEGDFLQGAAVGRFSPGGPLSVMLSWHGANHGIQQLWPSADPKETKWSWASIAGFSQDEQLSAGDIDSDGDLDLLLGTYYLRNGRAWTLHRLNPSPGLPDRNRLADINGDGRLDAVVGYESSRAKGKLAWYEQGRGGRGEWKEHIIAEIIGPMSLDVGDLDRDGDLDVVVGQHNLIDPSVSKLIIFENADGGGGLWRRHDVSAGDEHHDGTQLVDLDNDGDLDLISIGWTHARVLVYENQAISK